MSGITSRLLAGFAGGLAVLALSGLGALWVGPLVVKRLARGLVRHMLRDPYGENLVELLPTLKKVGAVEMMEVGMRAEQGGKPPSRPWGSQRVFSPWGQLLLSPVYLHRLPTPDGVKVDTSVVIGPAADRPLQLEIPILIGAMSFGGALSHQAKVALAMGASRMGTPPTPARPTCRRSGRLQAT